MVSDYTYPSPYIGQYGINFFDCLKSIFTGFFSSSHKQKEKTLMNRHSSQFAKMIYSISLVEKYMNLCVQLLCPFTYKFQIICLISIFHSAVYTSPFIESFICLFM